MGPRGQVGGRVCVCVGGHMCSGVVHCVRSPSVYRRHLGTKRLLKSVEHGGDDKGAAVSEMSLLRMGLLLVPAPALEGPPTPAMVVTRV